LRSTQKSTGSLSRSEATVNAQIRANFGKAIAGKPCSYRFDVVLNSVGAMLARDGAFINQFSAQALLD
jgi:hypothetical protein